MNTRSAQLTLLLAVLLTVTLNAQEKKEATPTKDATPSAQSGPAADSTRRSEGKERGESRSSRERGSNSSKPERSSSSSTAAKSSDPATKGGSAAGVNLDDFKGIADKNIFNPNRFARRVSDAPPPPKVDAFALVGTFTHDEDRRAFFDSPNSLYKKSIKAGESIANYKLTEIAKDSVKLEADGKETNLKLGQQIRRENEGPWAVAAYTTPFTAPVTPVYASTSSSSSSFGSSSSGFGGSSRFGGDRGSSSGSSGSSRFGDRSSRFGGGTPGGPGGDTSRSALPIGGRELKQELKQEVKEERRSGGPTDPNEVLRLLMERRAKEGR
jgi:hypothetical protein